MPRAAFARSFLPLAALVLLALAGCTEPVPSDAQAPAGPVPAVPSLAFGAPVLLTTEGPGFEPSLDAAPDGTLYAAAAKTHRPNDGATVSSWLWHSRDGGATWKPLPSPANVHALVLGLEGDTAVDGMGRFYFADTWLADNAIHRWSPGTDGPVWDWSRPVQGTLAAIDDRPWLAAQGDGVVYLMSNNAAGQPARMLLSISTDGGLTWLDTHGFPGAQFCLPAASPADDHTVLVACMMGSGPGITMQVHRSTDRGATWAHEWTTVMRDGAGYLPPGAAFDPAGNAYVVWHDDRVDWSGLQDVTWAGDKPGHVGVARSLQGGAWEAFDVTPFEGRFGMSHACAGRAGTFATIFYATRDLTPGDRSEWRAYAVVSSNADQPVPTWAWAPLADEPMAVGPVPPRDLFECAVTPDNAVHAILQRNTDRWGPGQPGDGIQADVLQVTQVAGANLAAVGDAETA